MSNKLLSGTTVLGAASASLSIYFMLRKTSDNTEQTGKVAADMTGSYIRQGAVRTAITLSDLAAATTAYASGGVKEIDSTNCKGVYRLDVPDAACATGVESVIFTIQVTGCYTVVKEYAISTQVVQSGDGYAEVAHASYGNSKLVRSTTPGNTLTVSATNDVLITPADKDTLVDLIWNELRSGHLVAGSYGLGAQITDDGTAQAVGATSIQLATSAPATVNRLKDQTVWVYSSTLGISQSRNIDSYAADRTCTVQAWDVLPTGTIKYMVFPTPQGAGVPSNFSLLSIDADGRVDLSRVLGSAINAMISGRLDVDAEVVGDKTGYALTQAFPTNFSSLSIDASGRIDLVKVKGSTINALVAGAVDASVSANLDKTGYALSQTFPTNFSSLSINGSGQIDLVKVKGSTISSLIAGRVDADVGAVATSTTAATNLSANLAACIPGTAITGTLSTTQMTTSLTFTNTDQVVNRGVYWTSGVLSGVGRKILAATTAGRLTYDTTPDVPADLDTIVIV